MIGSPGTLTDEVAERNMNTFPTAEVTKTTILESFPAIVRTQKRKGVQPRLKVNMSFGIKNMLSQRGNTSTNKLEHNQLSTYFYYLNNGLVAREESKEFKAREVFKWFKTKYNYDRKTYRTSSITKNELNKLGKSTKSTTYSYQYDRKGFLTKASQKTGETVNLKYDNNGKLDIMTDHKRSELRITYKVGVDKPVEIEQVKIGKVIISYDRNGEIETLDTPGADDRNIANSVIEKYVEMISYLGPKGRNLGI